MPNFLLIPNSRGGGANAPSCPPLRTPMGVSEGKCDGPFKISNDEVP